MGASVRLHFFLCLLLPSCFTPQKTKPLIVCTTGMIADVVANIAGDVVEVKTIMGPGIDPHVYRARAGDIDLLSRADLILYNGLHLEGKMGELFEKMKNQKPTIAVAQTVDKQRLRRSEFEGLYDPHIWHNVQLWREIIPRIVTALSDLLTDKKNELSERAQNYAQQLHALDAWVHEQAMELKPEQRILVTAHDAFGYFGQAYGFEVVGLQGISTDSEIGIKDIQELVDFIVEHKVPTIFVESSIPRRSLQAVQQAVQARGWHVELGDELFSDALGDATTGGDTYVTMIEHNVNSIVNGLVGNRS